MKTLFSTLTAAFMVAAVAAWNAPSPAYDHVVRIDRNFNPDHLEIHTGDKVLWKNFDSGGHTVTAPFRSTGLQGTGGFDSGVIPSGGSFEFTFVTEGTYKYYCRLNPEMMGIVVVTR